MREVRAANRLSKNCTLVVTTTGAAQSSIARRSLSPPSVWVRPERWALSSSMAEWCSSTIPGPSTSRNNPAVWSIMLVNGMA